ncbi:CHAT domain-containing protein [Suillus plorans]|uniref:CHAT domain-containing protein n=1 Tax=Suillus plorans TaxID=116603 RepID=A0A9P7AER0_9AGAM|nr:CHAT domain-containing protein [Suillus plorans]KAG1787326.1 CHAT domain-containing protein [Suillus plorans]
MAHRFHFGLPSYYTHHTTRFNSSGRHAKLSCHLHLLPLIDSNRLVLLNNIAAGLHRSFEQRGVPSDLDEAIENNRAALLLCPPDHSDRIRPLNNIADGLRDRFRHRGVLSDLDEAINLSRATLPLCPPSHPDRCILQEKFKQRGVPSDLDEAIECDRVALLIRPPNHPARFDSLTNLSLGLRDRFEQRGVPSDLDEAIELSRAAPLLCPPGHPDRSMFLLNLALSLEERFRQRGIPSDLDEAIEHNRAALLLRPPGHPERSSSLNNLSLSLGERFTQRNVPSDLDEAIEHNRAALLLRPHGHSNRSMSLNNLATSLQDRFRQHRIMSDLDEAIELHRAALLLHPAGNPGRPMSLNNLATSLRDRFLQRNMMYDLDEAIELKRAALLLYSPGHSDRSSSLSNLALSLQHRFRQRGVHVRHGALTTAVELVEQGRAVFWNQLARFSTPLDELSVSGDTGAALAEEFKRLSFRFRSAFDQSAETHSPQIWQLTMQWDEVVSRIRMLPDFSRFLLPPLFSDLQKAAEDGPVIILNASQHSCDALIIHRVEDPVHVPLDITQAEVSEFSSEFQLLAEQFGSSDCQLKLVSILRKLWNDIVDPVVQALRESNVCPGSRIWWCPTAEFTLLPLHAAGPYEKKKNNLSDIYISSYTPTLATLIRARQQVSRDASSQHFVAIGQGNPVKGKELECVAPELAVVAQHVAPIVSFTLFEEGNATVEGALNALNHYQWLHLACHGMPHRTQPFQSSFAMRDGPLMIKDIIRSDWQNREFAFLSACHTTVGDEKSPDESIHIAAAMQFCGFRSVIGSMWSVDDDVARQFVSAFYGHLVDGSGSLNCTRAAIALHKAVKSLRKINIPLEQQIVFVHIGI